MFTRQAGRVTLAVGKPYLGASITLARGLPYLPCKRSARDSSPIRVNFSTSCVTSNRANVNGIIQFLNLKNKIDKKIENCQINVFSIKNFKIISNFGPLQRMSRMTCCCPYRLLHLSYEV